MDMKKEQKISILACWECKQDRILEETHIDFRCGKSGPSIGIKRSANEC